MNNSEPSLTIPDDQCVDAQNVEFWVNALGERRLGCDGVDVPAAWADPNVQVVSWLFRHNPSANGETDTELWALGQHFTTQNYFLHRKTTSWNAVTPAIDIEVTSNQGFKLSGVSFHGKLFIAFPNTSGTDRLHVWDGSNLRLTGLAEAATPSAADSGGAGTLAGVRYYRVREITIVGSTTILRSEPSDALTFTPSEANASVTITKGTTQNTTATHWELEASIDNANFYVLATTVLATTTVVDSTAFTTGYAVSYDLSEDVGDYNTLHSPKFLVADEDRLLLAGAWEDSTKASRVLWTPVFGAEGVGNDERWEADTDPFIDLDNYSGGPITGISNPINGQIWVFKQNKIYVLVRTGNRVRAYQSYKVSNSIGAIEGSIVQGVDSYGQPCLYFIDPVVGPCRTGGNKSVQSCGKDILSTWEEINLDSAIVSVRSVFYPKKQQIQWRITTGASTSPTKAIVLHCANTNESQDGVRGGWSIWTGKFTEGYTSILYSDNINANTTRSLDLVPFVGVTSGDGYILQGDTGTADDGEAYAASIRTKPYLLRGLLQKFGVGAAAVLGMESDTAEIQVTLIRDFGLEEPRNIPSVDFAGTASETEVIKQLREFTGAQMYAMQIEFADVASPAGTWEINRFDLKISPEESA